MFNISDEQLLKLQKLIDSRDSVRVVTELRQMFPANRGGFVKALVALAVQDSVHSEPLLRLAVALYGSYFPEEHKDALCALLALTELLDAKGDDDVTEAFLDQSYHLVLRAARAADFSDFNSVDVERSRRDPRMVLRLCKDLRSFES